MVFMVFFFVGLVTIKENNKSYGSAVFMTEEMNNKGKK